MRKLLLVFGIILGLQPFSFSNSDSAFVRLNVLVLRNKTQLPIESVSVKVVLVDFLGPQLAYTNKSGVASFNLSVSDTYKIVLFKANGPCGTEFKSSKKISRSGATNLSDTFSLKLSSSTNKLGLQDRSIFFRNNSAKIYAENIGTPETGMAFDKYCLLFLPCGLEIHGYASWREKSSEKLARKRAEAVIAYLKANKYAYSNLQIVTHGNSGCGDKKTSNCIEEKSKYNRRVSIHPIDHD